MALNNELVTKYLKRFKIDLEINNAQFYSESRDG